MLTGHLTRHERALHFGDVNGCHEHVVADGGQQAVGNEQHARLLVCRERQHPVDQWGEQLLVVNHRDHGEKHHQQ
ncbi:hypothetical protein D9M71_680700 [compost metagenome]